MNPYNLRIQRNFDVPFLRTMYHRSESISYLGSKGINKGSKFVKQLFKVILKMSVQTCPCRVCKSYILGVGFVQNLL